MQKCEYTESIDICEKKKKPACIVQDIGWLKACEGKRKYLLEKNECDQYPRNT